MIPYFKDNEIRTSGVIHNAVLDQIKLLYEENAELAGELAISAVELVLTGDMSTNNVMIKTMLAQAKRVAEADKEKYERAVEAKKNKVIIDNKLDKVAEYALMGLTQAQIGERLGISQQSVSKKMGVIRRDYPELLEKSTTVVQPSTIMVQPDTSCTSSTPVVQSCTTVVRGCENKEKAHFDF